MGAGVGFDLARLHYKAAHRTFSRRLYEIDENQSQLDNPLKSLEAGVDILLRLLLRCQMANQYTQAANPPHFMMPVEPHMGPAMQALTENQRAFVVAMLETGARDATRCATIAGFGNTEGARWQAGHRLSHNPKVLAAIREEADKRLRSGAILGASVLVEIASNPLHKDQFKAGVELLNRSGLLVETQHRVIVEDDRRDSKEIEAAIIALAKRLGVDPVKLLGVRSEAAVKADAIDGEFEEVAMSSEGLEDLL